MQQWREINTPTSNTHSCPEHTSSLSSSSAESDFADSLGIVANRPRFTRYSTHESRLKTFERWPTPKTQDKKDMSTAGFVYCGKEDITQCFFCGISLKDWPSNACPWEQHIIASPECGHVKLCKGTNYIKAILAQQEDGNTVDDSCDVIDIVQIAMQRNSVAIEAAREFCTDDDKLRRAVKTLVKNNPDTKFNAERIVRVIGEEETHEMSLESVTRTKPQAEISSEESDELAQKKHITFEVTEDVETDCDDSEEEDPDPEETNRKLKESVNCKICYSALSCVLTLPCGHMVCCPQCVSALTKCAMCRVQIKGTVRAIMAV